MTKVSLQSTVKVSPDQLWKLIGQFNALPDWHPAVRSSKLEDNGRLRRLNLMGGGEIVERLETIDEKDRMYRYSIVSGPLPVANYTATLHVRDDGKGNAVVDWSSEFEPAGAAEMDAMKAVQGIYQAGFDNLKKMFGM